MPCWGGDDESNIRAPYGGGGRGVFQIGRCVVDGDVGFAVYFRLLTVNQFHGFAAGSLRVPIMHRNGLASLPESLVEKNREGTLADAAFLGE